MASSYVNLHFTLLLEFTFELALILYQSDLLIIVLCSIDVTERQDAPLNLKRKKTHNGAFLSFESFHPQNFLVLTILIALFFILPM